MKKFLLACMLLPCCALFAQNHPYGVYENPNNNQYYVVQVDPATAAVTTLDPIIGMTAIVSPDKTVIDINNNYYIFSSLTNSVLTLNTWNMTTETMVTSVPFSANVIGWNYNCEDSLIYGLYEFNNTYELVTVDHISGNLNTIASITTPLVAYVGGTFTLDPHNGLFSFIGHDGADLRLFSFDITNGALVYNNVWNGNVVGQVYNMADSTIYGVIETTFPNYDLVTVDPASGTYSSVGTLAGVTAGYIGDATCSSQDGTYIFRGFDASNNFGIFTVDLQTAAVLTNVAMTENALGFELPKCHLSTVGIEESEVKDNAVVFPNPFDDRAILSFSNPESIPHSLAVFSVTGKMVYNTNTSNHQIELSKNLMESGVYFYRLLGENGELKTGKFVIK